MKKILIAVMLGGFMAAVASAETLTLNYIRKEGDYAGWKLWVWNQTAHANGFDVEPKSSDGGMLRFELDLTALGLDGKQLGILPRKANWADKDAPDRMFDPAMPKTLFMVEGDSKLYGKRPVMAVSLRSAMLDSSNTVRLVLGGELNAVYFSTNPVSVFSGNAPAKVKKVAIEGGSKEGRVIMLTLADDNPVTVAALNAGQWKVRLNGIGEAALYGGKIFDTKDFYYSGELGALRDGKGVTFRVFAPPAAQVTLLLKKKTDSQDTREVPLAPLSNGVWQARVDENLDGWYYKYKVTRLGATVLGIDPYARAVTAYDGWGMIVADATPVAPAPKFDISQSVLYEMHIRDLTIDPRSGVDKKGKYLGMAEAGTRHTFYSDIKTGLDHLSELGVNAVHVMPVEDFASDQSSSAYNWGYMPVNFNSPEGWYATKTDDLSRVSEFKRMVDAMHKKGLKVIMDVVYNHTAESDPSTVYNFNAFAPGYYYRLKSDGTYYNGSGCGNEFRSDSPMGRKFIIDSVKYWMSEYKVDGFRFDLLGLIDVDTMAQLSRELRAINPDALVYGEPWTAGDTPIKKNAKGMQKGLGYAVFNDNFRDAIKGSVFDLSLGYVQSGADREAVKKGITGSIDDFTASPMETINYVSCHDNLTLWDRIVLSTTGQATVPEQMAMANMANAIVLTSQGIPFILSGEEMLRTKYGEDNSYNLPDSINMIDWSRKKEHFDVFEYYRGLIAMRKTHPAFRMRTAGDIRAALRFYEDTGLPVKAPGIAYTINGEMAGDIWKQIVVLMNPLKEKMKFALPKGNFNVAADGKSVHLDGTGAQVADSIMVPPVSLMVLYRQ
jgi:pullulanase